MLTREMAGAIVCPDDQPQHPIGRHDVEIAVAVDVGCHHRHERGAVDGHGPQAWSEAEIDLFLAAQNDMQVFAVNVYRIDPKSGAITATTDLGKQAGDIKWSVDIKQEVTPIRSLVFNCEEFTLTGLAFSPIDGQAALFDHIYLARQLDDFDEIKASKP